MEDNKDIDDNVVRDFLKQSSGTGFNVPEDYFDLPSLVPFYAIEMFGHYEESPHTHT